MNEPFYVRTGQTLDYVPLWNSAGGQELVALADLITLDQPEVITQLSIDLRVSPAADVSLYVVLSDLESYNFLVETRTTVFGGDSPVFVPIYETIPAGHYLLRVMVDAAPPNPDSGYFSEVAVGLSGVASDGLLFYTPPPGGQMLPWTLEPGDLSVDLYRFGALDVPEPGITAVLLLAGVMRLLRRRR